MNTFRHFHHHHEAITTENSEQNSPFLYFPLGRQKKGEFGQLPHCLFWKWPRDFRLLIMFCTQRIWYLGLTAGVFIIHSWKISIIIKKLLKPYIKLPFHIKKICFWAYFIKKNSLFKANCKSILGLFYASVCLV